MAERYDESVAELKKAIQTSPRYLEACVILTCTYSLMGRENDAKAAASEVVRIDPDFSVQDYVKTLPYKENKDLDRVIKALDKVGLK
jgi:adenylate cyclase